MMPTGIVLTLAELHDRALNAAQYEREAYEREDTASAHFWGKRYDELEDAYFELWLIELDHAGASN